MIDCYFIIFFNFRYTLLHVLEFDSTRKRMSVIVKSPQGFDIIWYRSNFFRRNNPLGMLEKKFLEQRLWYFARLAHPSWVCRNAFPVPLLVRLSILLKSVEYQLLVCLRKGRHFWVTPKLRPFPFNMPCSSQICIAECLYSYIEDLPETFVKTTAQEWKMSTSGTLFHVSCF